MTASVRTCTITAGTMPDTRLDTQRLGLAGLVVGAALVVYRNSFAGTFQFDDRAVIFGDPRLASVRAFVAGATGMIRPLLKLTFLFDRHVHGDGAAGYHLLNVLLHCGSGLLVFAIVSIACRWGKAPASDSGRLPPGEWIAWVPPWTALLFVVHPVTTETVTYISGRATGLAAFFGLLSTYLFLLAGLKPCPTDAASRLRPTDVRARFCSTVLSAGSILSFALALLSKETAAVVPALVLLCLLTTRASTLGPGVRRTLSLWATLAAAVLVAALTPRYRLLAEESLRTRPFLDNLLTQANAVACGLTLFVLPSRLSFDHDLSVVHSVAQWPAPLSLLVLGGMTAGACWSARRAPLVSLGLAWFLVSLLPTTLIPRYDILSERNLYLPSVGIILAVVAGLAHVGALWDRAGSRTVARRIRLALSALLVLAAVASGAATISRNRVYRDEVSFWFDAVRKSPQKARPHNNLGVALLGTGQTDLALQEFRAALAIDPANTTARANLRRAWEQNRGNRLP